MASTAPAPAAAAKGLRVRCGLRVRGTVQGVGFRPWVYRLATREGLGGFVRNDSRGVWIEVEGDASAVEGFPGKLRAGAPPLSRVEAIEVVVLDRRDESVFRVASSENDASVGAAVPSDAATCAACLRELFDPLDRRYRYPFVNCTDCGPRYTIVREVPYDRARTTMEAFALCSRCRSEYEDPSSRRFHAEPNACADCGPSLELVRNGLPALFREEALRDAVEELYAGRIVAVKGLGGFFLAADATREDSIARLRERKRRPHKPFALMARNLDAIRAFAEVSDAAARALLSPAAPIVLVPGKAQAALAKSIAPGLSEYGVMLPYTPLHHLLLADGPPVLVMTSGNVSEEPIARDDATALERLSGIADAFLLHDREIHTRADDSVVRVVGDGVQPVRRSRGFTPEPIALPFSAPSVLAVGAELKNTVCLTRDREAYLSPHVGDLENPETFGFFEEVIGKLERLLGVSPTVIAHDFHPDYGSTRWARRSRLPLVAVQHHHAHIASCLAENGRSCTTIGVAFDGTGCGPGGDLWGGEILLADLGGFRRLGHLRPIALAGGEAAIRQPWRLAAAALADAGESLDALPGIAPERRNAVRRLLDKRFASPLATGAGRWFDAVAALLEVRSEISYEGQAAIELEALAARHDREPLPFDFGSDAAGAFEIDLRPAVRAIVRARGRSEECGTIAAGFHETLSFGILESCRRARTDTAVGTVALSGGCFQNRRLTARTISLLAGDGFEVLVHRRVPPNDGGLALGQAAVAAWRLTHGGEN
jgi:hydrogenase maturation protein HypF